jgi:DUF4097 and DUF4098 domain-containing protein YvlB
MPSHGTLRVLAPLALLLGSATALLAQRRSTDDWLDDCRHGDWGGHARVRFCEVRETGFKGTGQVSIDPGANGGIAVSGWDRDSVAVTVRIQTQARTDDAARDLAHQIRISASSGTIRADGPSTSGRESWSVSFVVSVPRRSDVRAETVNGPISVEDVTGKMELRAVNGPLHLDGVGGDVHARTTNGPLVVSLNGGRWDGAGLDGETQNGPVSLTLPADYAAHLETGTVNGPVSIDFPITIQGRFNGRRIETDLGGGGPTVRAVTTNGPLTVRRR